MLVECVQRWRAGSSCARPAGEVFRHHGWEVEQIADDTTARGFVLEHHYSGSYPAARRRFGLWSPQGVLCGVAVFSVPAQPRCLDVLPGPTDAKAELGRFVLLDGVRANGESWMLGRCFDVLRREGWVGVVSFSDPVPRPCASGRFFPGHVGTIVYLGTSKARSMRVFPDGTVLHERALAKLRRRDRGWQYVAQRFEAFGASPPTADTRAWVDEWLGLVTAPVRHTGNHKYVWAFGARERRRLPVSLPYPKVSLTFAPYRRANALCGLDDSCADDAPNKQPVALVGAGCSPRRAGRGRG